MGTIEGGRRQRHSAEFKAKVVAVCSQPGVSMASVALADGLNANLLRRWSVEAQRTGHPALRAPPAATGSNKAVAPVPAFVPLPMAAALPAEPPEPIRIELIRGGTTIRVQWPLQVPASR